MLGSPGPWTQVLVGASKTESHWESWSERGAYKAQLCEGPGSSPSHLSPDQMLKGPNGEFYEKEVHPIQDRISCTK